MISCRLGCLGVCNPSFTISVIPDDGNRIGLSGVVLESARDKECTCNVPLLLPGKYSQISSQENLFSLSWSRSSSPSGANCEFLTGPLIARSCTEELQAH